MTLAKRMRQPGTLAGLSLSLALAGCGGGIGDFGDDVAKTVISGNAADKSVVDTVDIRAFEREVPCPPISVEDGRYIVMRYKARNDNNPEALLYQANLEKWARRCTRTAEGVKMSLGVSGRVTPGPAWEGGELFLPIRMAFVETGESDSKRGRKPKGQVFNVPVTLGAGAPAEQWALVEEGIAVPQNGSVKVQIALDEPGKRRH